MFFKNTRKSRSPETSGRTTLGSRERRLLSDSIHVEEELIPDFVRPILLVVGVLVLGFLTWASLSNMKEVARAPGEVIPFNKAKMVQHLDGGVVTALFVEERQLVDKDQVLLHIEGSQVLAEVAQLEARRESLRLRQERLVAYTEGRKPNFAALMETQKDMVSSQENIFITQLATRISTLSILEEQIKQRTLRVHQQRTALAVAKEQVALTQELSAMREDLAARRLINRTVLLETRRAKVTSLGEEARLTEEIGVAQQELAEYQNRYIDTKNQLRRDALSELGVVRAELAEVEEGVQRLKGRVDRLEVRAPSKGYVQDLRVQNVGQVFQPGALLMQIVSDKTVVEAEIRISPRDVGFVRVGQPVDLRVTSFDYARYGAAKGILKTVSASSIVGTDNVPYYKGLVELTNPYVGGVPGRHPLQPGMSVEAEILTGQKTLLAYLTKPVADGISRSFHER
jgi:HlyD family type I secretion membrane fusion protein